MSTTFSLQSFGERRPSPLCKPGTKHVRYCTKHDRYCGIEHSGSAGCRRRLCGFFLTKPTPRVMMTMQQIESPLSNPPLAA
jgi:hypothetical protein